MTMQMHLCGSHLFSRLSLYFLQGLQTGRLRPIRPSFVRLDLLVVRVTCVQPIAPTQHYIVAHVVELGLVLLARSEIDALECEVPARLTLGAVEPDEPVARARARDVAHVDVGPRKGARIVAVALVFLQVGQAGTVQSRLDVRREESGRTPTARKWADARFPL